jgi:hypothetical protein
MTTPAVTPADDAPLLLCPACGFDLRGTASDRCGECGLEIDRAGLRVSGIPWAHRDRMGWVVAYLKTARLVALDRDVRFEAARPQAIRDGRSFARVTACIVAVALIGTFCAGILARGHVALAVQPDVINQTRAPIDLQVLDLAVPWSAGAVIPGVLPACLVAFAFWLTAAQRFAFRAPPTTTDERARAAVALSCYTTTPLLLLLPAAAFCAGLARMIAISPTGLTFRDVAPLSLGAAVFVLAALGLSLLRIGQWLARTRFCGPARAILGAAEVVGLWLLGGLVLLGLAPWCVGFLRVAADSLR